MYVTQIADQGKFLAKARETKAPVRILKTPTVLPVTEAGAVLMKPAIVLRYSLVFPSKQFADDQEEWVFEEVRYPSERGDFDRTDTLLAELEKETKDLEEKIVVVRHIRSGSLD